MTLGCLLRLFDPLGPAFIWICLPGIVVLSPLREIFIFSKGKLCTIKYSIPYECVKEQNLRATKILSEKLLIESISQY